MRELVKRSLSVESRKANILQAVKQVRYFWMSLLALLLSACFPVAEKQFLVLAIIAGAKWIVDGSSRKINIFIN